MATRPTITLNLPDREATALGVLSREMGLSKTAVLRQALRLYQLVHVRHQQGETFAFSGDQQRTVEFIGPGFGEELPTTPASQSEGEPS